MATEDEKTPVEEQLPEPTNKYGLLMQMFNVIIAEVKDAKTLTLRMLAMLFGLLCYFLATNQTQIIDAIKNYGDSSTVEKIQKERVSKYPIIAKEKASFIYSLTGADFVGILEYEPVFQNNQADLIAYEGKTPIDLNVWQDLPLNKYSGAYTAHLAQSIYWGVLEAKSESIVESEALISKKLLKSVGISYIYSCPIFNLSNSYSGAILVGWKDKPSGDIDEIIKYVNGIVYPSARVLGRSK